MTVLNSGEEENISLPKQSTLTLVASASGSGRVTRLPDASGGASGGFQDIDPGETLVVGPFANTTQHYVEAFESTLTTTVGGVDFQTSSEVSTATSAAIAAALAAFVPTFPSEDPLVEGAGWWDEGVFTISAGPPTAPAQFGTDDWSVADDTTGGSVTITITTLPDDGGSELTDLEYQIDEGAWVSLEAVITDDYPVTGLTDDVEVEIAVRAVNAVGNGEASDAKPVTPTTA